MEEKSEELGSHRLELSHMSIPEPIFEMGWRGGRDEILSLAQPIRSPPGAVSISPKPYGSDRGWGSREYSAKEIPGLDHKSRWVPVGKTQTSAIGGV